MPTYLNEVVAPVQGQFRLFPPRIASTSMTHMMNSIESMDALSFYLVLGLSVLWSYFIYETTQNWLSGVASYPLFAGCSLVTIYVLQSNGIYFARDDTTEAIIGSCIGSVIGLAATFVAIQLMMNLSGARLNSSQKKEADRRAAEARTRI